MDNPDNISYADNWKKANNPVVYKKPKEAENTVKKEKKKTGKPVLTLVQIILCVVIALSAYAIKAFGGDLYKNIKEWYQKQLNDEIIINSDFEHINLENLINASEN